MKYGRLIITMVYNDKSKRKNNNNNNVTWELSTKGNLKKKYLLIDCYEGNLK